MAEKKQEKPKLPEVKNEQTILYKFGSLISGIVSSVLGTAKPKAEDKKPEATKSKPKEENK
jgi:hypothetical protein